MLALPERRVLRPRRGPIASGLDAVRTLEQLELSRRFGSRRDRVPAKPQTADGIANPLAIANCTLWLRADLGVTTGATFRWADQSATAGVFSQATALKQPGVNVAGIGGKRTLTFVSANPSELDSTVTLATVIGAASTAWTALHVVKYTGAKTTALASDGNAQIIEDTSSFWGLLASTTVSIAYHFDTSDKSARPAMTGGVPYYSIGGLSGGVLSNAVNGGAATTTAGVAANGGSITTLRIGFAGAGSVGWDGEIGEIALYNRALSAGELASLKTYAQGFWSL